MLSGVTTPQDLDERFRRELAGLTAATVIREPSALTAPVREDTALTGEQARALYDAQSTSRHLDLAARWLKSFDAGFYTIGSSGHEGNAAVATALRANDPALLHYRSGGFYTARAAQVAGTHQAEGESNLAARGTRKELARCHEVRKLRGLPRDVTNPESIPSQLKQYVTRISPLKILPAQPIILL